MNEQNAVFNTKICKICGAELRGGKFCSCCGALAEASEERLCQPKQASPFPGSNFDETVSLCDLQPEPTSSNEDARFCPDMPDAQMPTTYNAQGSNIQPPPDTGVYPQYSASVNQGHQPGGFSMFSCIFNLIASGLMALGFALFGFFGIALWNEVVAFLLFFVTPILVFSILGVNKFIICRQASKWLTAMNIIMFVLTIFSILAFIGFLTD